MRRGVNPACPRPSARAIEKQPACAAAISSSGLVPFSFSKRVLKEYRPSKAPLPGFMVPDPSASEPFHSASALRSTIASLRHFASAFHISTIQRDDYAACLRRRLLIPSELL